MIDDDELQLLRAIQADPDHDGPRLVYADFLQQRSDPRGEHVAISCELERDLPAARRAELSARAAKLAPKIPDLAFRYSYELPIDRMLLGDVDQWSRGFLPVRRVSCIIEQFAERKDTLFRIAPCARELRLWNFGSTPPWPETLADRAVARWDHIAGVPTAQLDEVAANTHLDSLRGISFDAAEDCEPAVFEPLFDSGRLPRLEALRVHGMAIDGMAPYLEAVAPERWAAASFAPALRTFEGEMCDTLDVFPALTSFSSDLTDPDRVARVAEFTGALTTLALGPYDEEPVRGPLLEALFRAPCTKALESLTLHLDRRSSHSTDAWSALDHAPLNMLSLHGNWLDDELVQALAAGPRLPALRALRLGRWNTSNNPPRDEVMLQLAERDWPKLEELDLGPRARAAPFLGALVARMPKLRRLRCGAAVLGDVLALDAIDQLEVLQISTNRTSVLPEQRRWDRMRLLQLQFGADDPNLSPRHAAQWAQNHGFELLPTSTLLRTQGNAAWTFARLAPGFWSWAAGFVL